MTETPAIATYHEWLGSYPEIPDHTRENAKVSIEAQGGDVESLRSSVHFHEDLGFWVFVSAPPTNAKARRPNKGTAGGKE